MGQRLPSARPVREKPQPPRSGAFEVQCRMGSRLEVLEKAEFKEKRERIQLLVHRYRLLTVAQHDQPPMSIDEALSWVDLALPMSMWLYNENACTSSLTGAVCLLQSEIEWPLDHVPVGLRDDAERVIEKLVFRDFWTGEQLSSDSCKWMPLVPCKYVDVRNMVAVNQRLDASSAFERVVLIIPKTGTVAWESQRADSMLPRDELPLKSLPERHQVASDSRSTLVCEQGLGVVPRSSVVGWIARVFVYLIDKFGPQSVSADFIERKALVDLVKLERTFEEFYFEVLCSRLTGDFNPLVLLGRDERGKYAQAVLEREEALAQPLAREFEFTVTAVYEKRVASVVDASGDEFEVDIDDPQLEPAIKEALTAFTE